MRPVCGGGGGGGEGGTYPGGQYEGTWKFIALVCVSDHFSCFCVHLCHMCKPVLPLVFISGRGQLFL